MWKSYVLKSQSHDPDAPNYIEDLSVENTDKYSKAMDDEIQSLKRRYTQKIVSRKSVAYHNVIPEKLSFKCKRKPDWKIRKFNAWYCVGRDIKKILSPKPLNLYSPVVKWFIVRLMLVLHCILVLQSQSIEFTNDFVQGKQPTSQVGED